MIDLTRDSRTPPVSVRNLSLRYGAVTVLDDVNFSLPRGAVLGVIGRNGAGKTSLLQSLVGLSVPQSGETRLFDCPSVALTDEVKARLGYVAQAPELFEWLRVGEHLSLLGALYPNWTEARAQALRARFELPETTYVKNMSLGEKQRLTIVLALAHQPDLLVFDEPVASLDPVGRRDFLRTLFEQESPNGEAVTVVISSHLLEDLERVVTHLLFLERGRVQLFGTRDELTEHIRLVHSTAAAAPQAGLLRHRQRGRDDWESVIDLRQFAENALPPTSRMQALGLGDLFVALNS